MFKAGIMSIRDEERENSVREMLSSLNGIQTYVFIDEERKGHPFNFTQMLYHFCNIIPLDETDYVILCTDDVDFNKGWYDELNKVIKETNYDIYSLFTNRKVNKTNEYGYVGTNKHSLYDVCVVYKASLFTPEYYKEFIKYTEDKTRTIKEKKHYDIMHSHFVRDKGYEVLVIQPNLVKHKPLKSTLGHNVKVG